MRLQIVSLTVVTGTDGKKTVHVDYYFQTIYS